MVEDETLAICYEMDGLGRPESVDIDCGCCLSLEACAHAWPALKAFAASHLAGNLSYMGDFWDVDNVIAAIEERAVGLCAEQVERLATLMGGPKEELPEWVAQASKIGLCVSQDRLSGLEFRPCVMVEGAATPFSFANLCVLADTPDTRHRQAALLCYTACNTLNVIVDIGIEHAHSLKARRGVLNAALRELAADGRLVDETGRRLTVSDEGLWRWRVKTPTTQALESTNLPLAWHRQRLAGLDVQKGVLYLVPGGHHILDRTAAWPTLDNAQVDQVASAIRAHRLPVPVPSKVDLGVVEEVHARWVVLIEFVDGPVPELQANLVAKAGDLEVRYLQATTGIHEYEGRWVSLHVKDLNLLVFHNATGVYSHNRPMISKDRVQIWDGPLESSSWPVFEIIARLQAADLEVICRGFTPIRVIRYDPKLAPPLPHFHVGPADDKGFHPLKVQFKVSGEDVDPEYGLSTAILEHVQLQQSNSLISFDEGETHCPVSTVEIQDGVFVDACPQQWALALLPYIHLYSAAFRKGKKRRVHRNAVMSAVLSGAQLSFEDPANDPGKLLAELLAAKTGAGVEGVPEIDMDYLPFQRQALKWLIQLRQSGWSGVLADDRGSGKTLDSIGAAMLHRATPLPKRRGRPSKEAEGRPPVLVVVERRDLQTWINELTRKEVSGVDWVWHQGSKRAKTAAELRDMDIILVTYGVMSRDIDLLLELAPEFVFLDEANSLKNHQSAKTRDVARFKDASVVPITGTPVDHNPLHLHALMDVAMPGLLGRRDEFAGMQRLINHNPSTPLAEAERARVAKVIAPFLLRRTKAELDQYFPEKREQPILITMDRPGAASYRHLRIAMDDRRNALLEQKTFSTSRFELNAMLEQLRRSCARVGTPRQPTEKGKFLLDLIKERRELGEKVVVFSHFNGEVVAITELLRKAGINAGQWVGQDAPSVRDREYSQFQQGHTDVLVVGAYGARGLDLPQASCCIIADPWIDITTDDQMGDRVHRLSSEQRVTIYRLALAGTIEQVALEFAQKVTHASEAVLTGQAPAPGRSGGLLRADYDHMFAVQPDLA